MLLLSYVKCPSEFTRQINTTSFFGGENPKNLAAPSSQDSEEVVHISSGLTLFFLSCAHQLVVQHAMLAIQRYKELNKTVCKSSSDVTFVVPGEPRVEIGALGDLKRPALLVELLPPLLVTGAPSRVILCSLHVASFNGQSSFLMMRGFREALV